MGRIYLEHMNGNIIYNCANCGTNLTNSDHLVKKEVFDRNTTILLFKKVVNLFFYRLNKIF